MAGATTCALDGHHAFQLTARRPARPVQLPLLGAHNVRNALAAMAVGADRTRRSRHARGPPLFAGVKRRLGAPRRGSAASSVYDDFAHHPTAVAETSGPSARRTRRAHLGHLRAAIGLVVPPVFQDDFADAFADADRGRDRRRSSGRPCPRQRLSDASSSRPHGTPACTPGTCRTSMTSSQTVAARRATAISSS